MNKKHVIGWLLLAILITMLFFTYQTVITYDSSHYLWLSTLLSSQGDFSTWDVARGPVFPGFIKACNVLFGQSSFGLVVGMFLFYLVMLLGCYLLYRDTIQKESIGSKKMKLFLGIAFFLLVVVNPIVIGYYHTLLTEFFGMTLAVISCYLAWKWMNVNFKEHKIAYSLYTIVFSVLMVIGWQLKQPYVGTVLFPVIIAAILSFIREVKWKNFIQRLLTLVFCAIVLVISLKGWNWILEAGGVEMKQERTSAGFFATGLMNGLTEYEIQQSDRFATVEKIEVNQELKQEDKIKMKDILEGKSKQQSFTVIDTNKEHYEVIYSQEGMISTGEAIGFVATHVFTDPFAILNSYLTNYLATISIYPITFEGMDIVIQKQFNLGDTVEIGAIGFRIYEYGNSNVFPLSEEYAPYAQPYQATNKPVVAANWFMRQLKLPNVIAMKISFLVLPILLLISIIMVFRSKKRYHQKYRSLIDLMVICFGFSFLHIMVHAVLGSTIDRYSVPAIIPTYLGIFLGIYLIVYRKKLKKEDLKNEKM